MDKSRCIHIEYRVKKPGRNKFAYCKKKEIFIRDINNCYIAMCREELYDIKG